MHDYIVKQISFTVIKINYIKFYFDSVLFQQLELSVMQN